VLRRLCTAAHVGRHASQRIAHSLPLLQQRKLEKDATTHMDNAPRMPEDEVCMALGG